MIMDPISDMLTRIRNAQLAKHKVVKIANTKINLKMSSILKKEGYIESFRVAVSDKKAQNDLELQLKYLGQQQKPAITNLKRLSSPGLRLYSNFKDIPLVLNGMGVVILSTSSGLMTDHEARLKQIGGEILCEIW